MAYDEYREKLKHIHGSIERCKEVYPNTFEFCGNLYNHIEDLQKLLRAFRKELMAYKKELPKDLIEKIDQKQFDEYKSCWSFGNEDTGWYFWGPQDEIVTTFAYYYCIDNDFEKAMEKTLSFYKNTPKEEWPKGRIRFLELLLLS